MEDAVNIIQTVGVPIFAMLALGWFVMKLWDQQNTDNKEREHKYQEQIAKFSDALTAFNITLTKIDTRLNYLEEHKNNES